MKTRFLFILSLLYILISCSPVKYGYLDISGINGNIVKEITDKSSFYDISEKIDFVSKDSREYTGAEKKNTLITISLSSAYSFEKTKSDNRLLTAVISRELHIPVTDFRNTKTDSTEEDIIKGRYKTDIPGNVRLPEKGLSFNRLYPDNPDYSLFREIRLTASIPEKISDKKRDLLEKWISEINLENCYQQRDSGIPESSSLPSDKKYSTALENNTAEEFAAASGIISTGETVNSEYPGDDIIWIGAVGDIMPARGVQDILISDKKGTQKIFSDTLPLLQSFDLLLGNLEGPVTYYKTAIEKAYNFKFRHKVLEKLKKAGFDYLSAVNNHCYDFDEQGFLDTLYNLNRYKITTSGAGENINKALKPALFRINGTDFRILALADYPAEKDKFEGRKETAASDKKPGILWPSESVYSSVRKMSEKEGISIISVHGGYEWQNQPSEKQKKLYRKLIDLGADIVIGSHPHVIQPVEVRNGSLIIYSLGNFIFPGMDETEFGEESMILSIGIYKGKPLFINYIPVDINGKYLSVNKSGKILKRFNELNNNFQKNENSKNKKLN